MVNSIQLNPGADLYAELKEFVGDLNKGDTLNVYPDETFEVTLSQGNYTLSNRLEFRCNVIIRGNGAKISGTNFEGWGDDCLFAIKGENTAKLKFEVYDCEFNFSVMASTSVARYYFKIIYADCVVFKNTKINLRNGIVTNIDLRRCSNIEIANCILENYNECKEGGVLWIRGETSNVIISNNIIRKHGNDEALAIWGDGNLGEAGITSVVKQNIQVINNTFEYGRTGSVKYGIDKYIAFYDADTSGNSVSYEWNNVLIAGNRFELTDLVRNLIHLSFGAKNTTVCNMTIEDNIIEHSGYAIEKDAEDSTQNDFERDFVVLSQSDNEILVSIRNNNITANQTVYADSNRYINLLVENVKVDYFGNVIDASGLLTQYDSTGAKLNTIGVIGVDVVGQGGKIKMIDNELKGLFMLMRCDFRSYSTVSSVDLIINNNFFEGDNRIWSNLLDKMTAHINGNHFISNSYYLLFQNFGAVGSLSACNNIWEKSDSYSGYAKIYRLDSGLDSPEFQKIIFAGNQFLNFTESQVSFSDLPTANIRITDKNIFK